MHLNVGYEGSGLDCAINTQCTSIAQNCDKKLFAAGLRDLTRPGVFEPLVRPLRIH